MLKCPNCGSSAQLKLINHQTFIYSVKVSLYLDYKCGCGCLFSTREVLDRKPEEAEITIEKGGN